MDILKVTQKATVYGIVLCAVFCLFPMNISSANGEYETETLVVNGQVSCDFMNPRNSLAGDWTMLHCPPPTPATDSWFEDDREYLQWGNATDTDGAPFGVGRGIFKVSNPVQTNPYWKVNLTYYAVGIKYSQTDNFHSISGFSLSVSGAWLAANIGLGYTTTESSTVVEHYQMHTQEAQDSWWWLNGVNYPGWYRPGTGIDWWDSFTNDIMMRPWTLSEIQRLVVIMDLSFQKAIFSNIVSRVAGDYYAIALGGLLVEVTPVDYTPPDYSGGFILRPDGMIHSVCTTNDSDNDSWHTESYNHTVLHTSINESTWGSDLDSTYITANWSSVMPLESEVWVSPYGYLTYTLNTVRFSFTNPPIDAYRVKYDAYIWAIVECDYQTSYATAHIRYAPESQLLTGYSNALNLVDIPLMYRNFSMPEDRVVSGPFNLDQLRDMACDVYINIPITGGINQLNFYPDTLGALRISQIAIICIPSDVVYDTEIEIHALSVIWLFIIFLPAIVLQEFVPKIGYVMGVILMLMIFGLTRDGFFPITIMGMISTGILAWRG